MNINLTLIIQGLAFFAVVLLVMKYGWPAFMAAIEERQKRIAEGLAAAERARAELRDADARVAEEIKAARHQAAEIIDRAQHQANLLLDKAREDAIAEMQRHKAAAETEIAAATVRAREELSMRVGELVLAGASKILQREVDASTHRQMLDELAAEI
ncbi:F0F1 ATP synthase subunit B [Metallibacterium sp.]|jgi:F-type H+-transporting ATPase subunit b|uniref:ATPase, F0 complex, subunit B, bacterial n=2 Tax=mine drainage metagenome TaxID=410659 RepID=T1AJH9_9ZZZZ|nr:F0F1 ATP synthase subunit B [Metallibacterium sp.]